MEFIRHYFNKLISLSDESIALLATCTERIEIKKNTIIMEEGFTHPFIYILDKGCVRGFNKIEDKEITTTFWMENETFGDASAYVTNLPISKSYQAMENLIFYRVDKMKFRQLLTINLELATLGRLIVESFIVRSDIRLKILSLSNPKDRYDKFCELREGIPARVKLKYIASYLQIAPETLSRIRSSC